MGNREQERGSPPGGSKATRTKTATHSEYTTLLRRTRPSHRGVSDGVARSVPTVRYSTCRKSSGSGWRHFFADGALPPPARDALAGTLEGADDGAGAPWGGSALGLLGAEEAERAAAPAGAAAGGLATKHPATPTAHKLKR